MFGTETDVECGGADSTWPACASNKACVLGTDCQSGNCMGGLCQAPSCTDGIKNGAETDVDCGGTACPACETGKACAVAKDCDSQVCPPRARIWAGPSAPARGTTGPERE